VADGVDKRQKREGPSGEAVGIRLVKAGVCSVIIAADGRYLRTQERKANRIGTDEPSRLDKPWLNPGRPPHSSKPFGRIGEIPTYG
jgi:hypothetical protein